jgi:hypothetical protein
VLHRPGLVIAAALVSINIWTGSPLLALWIGSRVQGDSGLSMGPVVAVVVVLAALVLALTWTLAWLSARYDELTGRPAAARQTSPWLRSMRDERGTDVRRKYGVSAMERIVIVTAVAAVLTFEEPDFEREAVHKRPIRPPRN